MQDKLIGYKSDFLQKICDLYLDGRELKYSESELNYDVNAAIKPIIKDDVKEKEIMSEMKETLKRNIIILEKRKNEK